MKRVLLLATVAAFLAAPAAYAQTQQSSGQAAAAAPMTPEEYVQKASIGDMFEIQSSELAMEKSKSDEIKKMAEQLIKDHKTASAGLAKAAKKEKLDSAMATTLDEPHQAMLDELKAADADFDQKFVQMQMKAHEEAVALHTSYGKSGDNKTLTAAAKAVRPTVQWHADMISKLPGA